jgi:hypothetical protein
MLETNFPGSEVTYEDDTAQKSSPWLGGGYFQGNESNQSIKLPVHFHMMSRL